MAESKGGYWNVWWTLTVLALVFTLAVSVLEYLGVFRDLGMVLSALGLLLGVFFGLTASTRSSVAMLRGEVRAVAADVQVLHPMVSTPERIEAILEARLPRSGGA